VEGRFYDRATYPTGFVIDWRKGRTGNVLLKREMFVGVEEPFNPAFRTGEDQEFFSRMIANGRVFVWCNEAVAYETVPPTRWTRGFLLRRYWLRGSMEPQTPDFSWKEILKSIIAVPIYLVIAILLLACNHSKTMLFATKLSYHLGKLLAFIGINPVKDAYVTS
jgi:succinoglycan biosynthesis protein ExoM